MTYRSKVISLSASLAALVLIYAAGLLFQSGGPLSRSDAGRLLVGKAADVTSLTIETPGQDGTLSFKKEGSDWRLAGGTGDLPVQSGRVDSFLEALAAVNRLSVRSTGSEEFGLGAGKGRHIVAKDAKGKVLADFRVGDYGFTGKEVYVRLASGPSIYAVASSFESYAAGSRSSWLDLRLFTNAFKAEDVQSIALDSRLALDQAGKPQKPFAWKAERKDGAWAGGKLPYDSVAVESVLRAVQSLSAEDILVESPKDAFSKVEGRVELALAKGQPIVVELGAATADKRHYLRTNASGYVYLVSDYSLGGIFRAESSLLAKGK